FSDDPPVNFDLCIDALLGLGAARAPEGKMAEWVALMRTSPAPCLSIDLPSGLNANTGCAPAQGVRADHTLSLLTLKPGLFTAEGRDASGQVWFDDLGVNADAAVHPAVAVLGGPARARPRLHTSHKGSFGDVAVLGGASGMTGAALLCASAALHGGAGRVYLCLLGAAAAPAAARPELMQRDAATIDLAVMTAVCGCGGGDAVRAILPRVLATAARAVIDADALNALAADAQLCTQLRQRAARARPTVITPHPLEAARLLGCSATQVQTDRLGAAAQLAERFQCVVVLKGSGSIVAAPGAVSVINPTGNARLATAGTGDVLAGMVGAGLAAGVPAFEAACDAVHAHGLAADRWPAGQALTADALARHRM
ncbi:MAG: NAD(P)H-hydrate dehydratase, partial [Burkholderiaceae bacterium]|nr:NAD(P)H-hydrate dehydratase [Burkholderiaceae bacterium]